MVRRALAISLACVIAGCGRGEVAPPPAPSMIDEVRASGLLQYLDEGPVPTVESSEGGTTVYAFAADDGPRCMRGASYRFSTREAPSDNLLIFLQGGGACWSDFCLAVVEAPAGIPDVEALDPDNPSNPMADWDVLYLPYCDGSLFSGDADIDEDGDGTGDRLHRGLQNLSGALRTARQVFPSPARVLLTGSSAGGYGTIPASMLVRAAYPETTLQVFADSGVGLGRPEDPAFMAEILDEFAIADRIPASCEACWEDGHVTRVVAWILERDPTIQMAVFSSLRDSVIAGAFLDVEPTAFEAALLQETGDLNARFPERYRRFLVSGVEHTALLGSPIGIIGEDLSALEFSDGALQAVSGVELGSLDTTAIDGFTVGEWLRAFVESTEAWTDRVALTR